MYERLHKLLSRIVKDEQHYLLFDGQIGLEKESLRVDTNGKISQQPHPVELGSALTNTCITTDYSEALLEFITPPVDGVVSAMEYLSKTHQFVYRKLNNEYLWNASMPCVVAGEASIPIAQYGPSNLGVMKTVYRRGLGYRYGKMMQVIAGVHFNYSFKDIFWAYYKIIVNQKNTELQDFKSDQYLSLIRNLQRYGWLIYYLFGCSPAICKSFLQGHPSKLDKFDDTTYYLPYATTLRMGDIGYTNKRESEIGIKACYDSLEAYVNCLTYAIETPCPEFQNIGIKVAGEYRQLNANFLQVENEYYSSVRPKQIAGINEKPTHALSRRGVRYVELRSLDLNMYDPLGVSDSQLYFLEAFMIFCLLQESPLINEDERTAIDHNGLKVAHDGRNPGLKLVKENTEVPIKLWGREILHQMQAICEVLDAQNQSNDYSSALRKQIAAMEDPSLTPSARMLDEMRDQCEGFFEIAQRYSKLHQNLLLNNVLENDDIEMFEKVVNQSIDKQRQIEASDTLTFDQFLHDYFSQTLNKQLETA